MEFNFKTPFIVLLVAIGIGYYLRTHYTGKDVLAYAHRHPESSMSPPMNYYVGMGYYLRAEYPQAAEAFTQLLTDYPTCQYAETGMVRLGDSDEQMRRWDDARAVYEKYFEQFPRGPDRNMVQERYNRLRDH